MNRPVIRFIRPLIPPPEEWIPHLQESYASQYFTNTGPATRSFEAGLKAKYARGRAVVTGPNATNSLVAALQALGICGKVLTPSYTFTATAQAILMAGCEPVFCDISAGTWGMDPGAVERALAAGGIAAIMHMRPYGFGQDAAPLEGLAKQHGIPLIIDSASALGGPPTIDGHIGQQGDIEVFSLHATKVFAIGEGGAAFMRPDLEDRFRRVSNFGIRYPDEIVDRGGNSKLSDFQAAVGLAVLARIDDYVARRRRIAQLYHQRLAGLASIQMAPPADWAPWQYYPVLLKPHHAVSRVVAAAMERGLELKRGYFQPLHRTAYFSRYAAESLPVTDALAASIVCLPVYSDMQDELAEEVLHRFLAAVG